MRRTPGLNWRPLLFELVIVFVGLLAALQVDDYRQQREFRQAQQRYLVRLHEDLGLYLRDTEQIFDFLVEARDATNYVWDSIQAGELIGNDRRTFEKGLIYMGHLPSNPLPRSAYDEMVASGMFSALESVELQRAISRLFATHAFMESNFAWWRENVLYDERYIDELVDFYDDPGEPVDRAGMFSEPVRRVDFDLAALATDRVFRNSIYWARDTRSDWVEWNTRLRTQALEVSALLEAELAKGG
jgi:hypothetical protein